jgi:hypothetical protein
MVGIARAARAFSLPSKTQTFAVVTPMHSNLLSTNFGGKSPSASPCVFGQRVGGRKIVRSIGRTMTHSLVLHLFYRAHPPASLFPATNLPPRVCDTLVHHPKNTSFGFRLGESTDKTSEDELRQRLPRKTNVMGAFRR